MKKKSFAILTGVLLVLILTTVAVMQQRTQESLAADEAGKPFLSGFSERVNDVARVTLTKGRQTLTVERRDGQWRVAQHHGYPADFNHVRQLLLALGELKTVEAKTRRPENYPRLDVQDAGEGSNSLQLDVYDAQKKPLASLIVGRLVSGQSPGGEAAHFVRKAGDAQVWLVAGRLEPDPTEKNWLDKTIVDLAKERVRHVVITQPDKSRVELVREKPADANFTMANLPVGKSLRSASATNGIAAALANLRMESVQSAEGFAWDEKKASKAEFETFDGLRLKVAVLDSGQHHYLRLTAEPEQAAADHADAIQREVQAINDRTGAWVYEISAGKAETLGRKQGDLVL